MTKFKPGDYVQIGGFPQNFYVVASYDKGYYLLNTIDGVMDDWCPEDKVVKPSKENCLAKLNNLTKKMNQLRKVMKQNNIQVPRGS